MNKIKLLFLLIFFFNIFLNAQNLAYKHPFWLSAGLGGDEDYLNINASFNKAFNEFSYQVSINGTAEMDAFPSEDGMVTGTAAIGLSEIKKWLLVSIFAGPSVSHGAGDNKFREHGPFWGAGFLLNGQVYFMPLQKYFPGLGIGLELFYNYNAMQTRSVNFRNVYIIRLSAIITDLHELMGE